LYGIAATSSIIVIVRPDLFKLKDITV